MQRRMRALSRLLLCHHVISLVVIHTSAFVSPFTERATPRQQHYGSTTDDHDEKKQAFVDNNSLDLTPLAFGTIPDAFSLDDDVTGMATSVSDASSLAEASAQAAALQVAPPPSSRANNKLPLIQLALAGSLTTLVVDILMHPVDCIKTLQQSDAGLDYTLAQAAQFLWSTYGLAGFYHGFLTYAVSDALGGALKFSVWETWKDKSSDFVLYDKISWLYVWIGAALAFVASSVFVVPGELLKQQLQMSYFDSVQTAVFGIFARSGLSGFFVGYDGVLYRDVPVSVVVDDELFE